MAPTLVASYTVNSTGSDTTTLTTVSFTPAVGEIIVVKATNQNTTMPTGGSVSSTGGLTFTLRDSLSGGSFCDAWLWTAPVITSAAMTVSTTWSGTAGRHGMVVERWSGAQLATTPALVGTKTGSGAPSTALTTTAANSVVTWICADWNAVTGTRTYRSSATEVGVLQDSATFSYYAAYQAAVTAGSQTLGMTAPTGQAWKLLGVELQPAVGGGGGGSGTGSFTGGSGGPLTDRTNVSYSNGVKTSTYHIYAAGLDWSKRVGLLVYGDGSGEFGLANPTNTYLLAGTNGLIAVAKKHNMVLVTPRAPGNNCTDGDGVCWYLGSTDGTTRAQKTQWLDDLIKTQVLSLYNIDKTRVCISGFSSGAENTAGIYGPAFAASWMEDGLLLAISYGSSPAQYGVTNTYTTAFKQKVAVVWDVYAADETTAVADSLEGYNWYTTAGFATLERNVIPGGQHDRPGEFGGIVDQYVTEYVAASTTASGGAVSFRAATDDARGVTNPAQPALPVGVVEGDLLIAVQTSDLNGSLASMTAPAGWTERGSSSRTGVGFMKVWTKVAGPSEPADYTFPDSTSAQGSAIVIAVTGQDVTSPLAVAPTFSSGAADTTHPASSAAGVAGGMLITAHLAGTAGTLRTYTAPSGMTTAETSSLTAGNAPNILTGAYYQTLSTAGQTGTKSATCSASTPYVTMSLVVAPVTNTVTVTPGTAGSTGAAPFAAGSSASFALTANNPVRLTGKANAPTVTTTSASTTTAGRGSATGKANNPTVTVSSTTSTTVTAGATASGTAYGSNTGAVFGFNVISSVPQGSTGLFPSETLFPSEGLFPSAGEGAAAQTVSPPGIGSGEVVGSPAVSVADGPQSIIATSIGSAEAIGVPTITTVVGPQDITAAGGIGTTEVVGRPSLSVEVGAPPPPPPAAQYLDTYYVDGIDLAQFTTQIEVAEGLQDTPGTFGEDVVLPGRDGLLEVWGGPGQQRRPDGPGKVIFSMWLLGVDPVSGALLDPADSAAAYQARWDELVRMFHRRRITIDHPRPDGTRRAVGYLTPQESMAPASRVASPWFGRFKASVTIPAGHWTDPTEVTTGPTPLTNNGGLSLSPWAAATAPCTELVITFGPGNNPRLSTSYGFVGWNGTIAPGRELTIDTVSGQLGYGGGQVWTPAYDGLVYSPGPRLFEIDPSEPLQAVLTHTGGGSMSVEVSGRRRYRTS